MSRPKGGTAPVKIVRRNLRSLGQFEIDTETWSQIEMAVGKPINEHIRSEIEGVTIMFGSVRALHPGRSKKSNIDAEFSSVSAAKFDRMLTAWITATQKLRVNLGGKQSDETDVGSLTRHQMLGRLDQIIKSKKQPTAAGLFNRILAVALDAAKIAQLQKNVPGAVKDDLWDAWAVSVSRGLARAGIKISASSSPEVSAVSPFVRVLLLLQNKLDRQYRRYSTPESLTKGFQKARSKMKNKSDEQLRFILAAWGMGLVDRYDLGELPTEFK